MNDIELQLKLIADALSKIRNELLDFRLKRCPSPSHHLLGDRSLADLDTELEQFAMDPGRTPERVRAAHFPDQIANLAIHGWPPGSGAPAPK